MMETLAAVIPHEWFHSLAIMVIGALMSIIGLISTIAVWLGARSLKTLVDTDIALKKTIDNHVKDDSEQFARLSDKIDHLAAQNSSEHQSILSTVASNNMMLKSGGG
jgi:hypothetical protein